VRRGVGRIEARCSQGAHPLEKSARNFSDACIYCLILD
jgi:hypothetical protein